MKSKLIFVVCLSILTLSCHKANVKQENPIAKADNIKAILPDSGANLKYDLAEIDKGLSRTYDSLSTNYYGSSSERFLPLFEKQLQNHLKNKLTYESKLDSLSNRISIIRSHGVNFYSFDDMTGGTRRFVQTYIQYKGLHDVYLVQKLKDEGLVTDAYPFKIDSKNYQLVISRSTSSNNCGSVNLRVFQLKGDKLIQTAAFFPDDNFEVKNAYLKKDDSLNGKLTDKVFRIYKYGEVVTYDMEKLRFNAETNSVSYDAFAFGKNGIYKTGKRIEWKLKKR